MNLIIIVMNLVINIVLVILVYCLVRLNLIAFTN